MEMAKDRSVARNTERKGLLAALARATQEATKCTAELEKKHADAHAARAQQHDEQDQKVLARLTEEQEKLQAVVDQAQEASRIAAEEAATSALSHAVTRDATQQMHQQDPQTGLEALHLQLREAQRAMKEQLEETQKQHQAQLQLLKEALDQKDAAIRQRNLLAAKEKQVQEDHHRRVDGVALETMPFLQVPSGDQLAKQGQLFTLLQSWEASGAATPVTFQNLMDHSKLGADAPMFMRTVLGSAFSKWFPEEPAADTVLPKQALLLVYQSLYRLKQTWEGMEKAQEVSTAAAGSFAIILGEAKRKRAELLDVLM